MRKQYLVWMILVFGIIGSAYGGFNIVYIFSHEKELSIAGLTLLIFGLLALILFLALYIPSKISEKKKIKESANDVETEKVVEVQKNPVDENKPSINATSEVKKVSNTREYSHKSTKNAVSYSRYDVSTIYVKLVGYGPILRVEGNRILDMGSGTYYRIEGNMVKEEGSGPLYEIRGNQIKNTFGGYLYEISGGNINKIYGGFYASISGNYITLFDLSKKYEMTGSLSKIQLLAVIVLLFGRY